MSVLVIARELAVFALHLWRQRDLVFVACSLGPEARDLLGRAVLVVHRGRQLRLQLHVDGIVRLDGLGRFDGPRLLRRKIGFE